MRYSEFITLSRLLIKRHWIAIVLAIVIGLTYVLPNLIFVNSPDYRGLPMMYADAEPLYLARINKAYVGCVLSCNPFIREYGNSLPFFDSSLSESVLAFPGLIFHVPIIKLKVFYEFFLPITLFLLVYSLAFRLIKNIGLSLVIATFILLEYDLFNFVSLINLFNLTEFLKFKLLHYDVLTYSRPVNPQFSSIIFGTDL